MIWGEKTTTQQAIDIDLEILSSEFLWGISRRMAYPQMPLNASISMLVPDGGDIATVND